MSSRTVWRLIKSGKVEAELVPGPFGEEYRIPGLPSELHRGRPLDNEAVQTTVQAPGQTPGQIVQIIRELQERNLALAAQLGAATERIRNLENSMRLLTAARGRPWWKRLFGAGR